jgi:hypothetical protein
MSEPETSKGNPANQRILKCLQDILQFGKVDPETESCYWGTWAQNSIQLAQGTTHVVTIDRHGLIPGSLFAELHPKEIQTIVNCTGQIAALIEEYSYIEVKHRRYPLQLQQSPWGLENQEEYPEQLHPSEQFDPREAFILFLRQGKTHLLPKEEQKEILEKFLIKNKASRGQEKETTAYLQEILRIKRRIANYELQKEDEKRDKEAGRQLGFFFDDEPQGQGYGYFNEGIENPFEAEQFRYHAGHFWGDDENETTDEDSFFQTRTASKTEE